MNNLKFRAYNSKENKFIYSFISNGINRLGWFFANTKEFKVDQYIGLKDKNGRDIYENDLIVTSVREIKDMMLICQVTLYDGSYKNPYCYRRMAGGSYSEVVGRLSNMNYEHMEIYSNVHENPELIKIL